MFDRILIPLDGSLPATSALYAGERLADLWDADIKILTLLRKSDRTISLDRTVQRQANRIRHEREVDIRGLSYSVAEDIAAEFDGVENTLVVMSTWARGRGAGVLSNVAEDVMRHIRKPMLLLGPDEKIADDWPSGPFHVCTDGSEFAESIVPIAADWANSLGLVPTVLGVVDDRRVPAAIAAAAEGNTVARTASRMQEAVTGGVEFDTLHGSDPARAIVDYAERSGAAMIAMATHGRSGFHRVRYGSVAMGVIRHARCPVLVNRPPVAIDLDL